MVGRSVETESKYSCQNPEFVRGIALGLGFEDFGTQEQTDTYYLVGRLADDLSRHYLRLRHNPVSGSSSMDFHRNISEMETEEFEVTIPDRETMHSILQLLGLRIQCVVQKKRQKLLLGKMLVTIDEVQGLGTYVEVEGQSISDVVAMCSRLGLLEENRISRKGYPEMVMEKNSIK